MAYDLDYVSSGGEKPCTEQDPRSPGERASRSLRRRMTGD